jgi:hypothetical protein
MLVALSVAAGLGLVCWQSASAAPVNPAAVQQAATAAAAAGQVQNAGYRHRYGGYVKCYHELVVGPYRCHRFCLIAGAGVRLAALPRRETSSLPRFDRRRR